MTDDQAPIPGLEVLAESIRPQRDLFADIERRIESPTARFTRWLRLPLSLSALAAAAVVLFVVIADADPKLTPSAVPTPAGAEGPDPALSEALATYRDAGAQLLKALEARRATIPDAVWSDIEQSLADIDQQLRQIEAALAHSPDDTRLIGFAFAAHQQRVAVLSRLIQTFSRT